MKFILSAFLLGFLSTTAHSEIYDYRVTIIEVIDADTVKAEIPVWPEPLRLVSIRVNSINSPEKGGKALCEKERLAGDAATAFAKSLVKPGDIVTVKYNTKEKDKFGRLLSDIYFDDGSRWSEKLIKSGHAVEYHGEKKSSFCD